MRPSTSAAINMFKRSFASKDRAGKSVKNSSKRSFNAKQKLLERLDSSQLGDGRGSVNVNVAAKPVLTSAIVTIVVGKDHRLFAAHEDALSRSPFFAQACRDLFFEANAKRLILTDEEPETFSCVLEYLYKGDYYPRLLCSKGGRWHLEDSQDAISTQQPQQKRSGEPTMYHSRVGDHILRDTAVYCAAERFGLEELKRLALRKQGLQSGIGIPTILRSARYAYDNTPEHDSALRAHYLALIIRSRKTFKRSGTMQMEMEMGGKLWWDLFVAMCNHMDDLAGASSSPKTI